MKTNLFSRAIYFCHFHKKEKFAKINSQENVNIYLHTVHCSYIAVLQSAKTNCRENVHEDKNAKTNSREKKLVNSNEYSCFVIFTCITETSPYKSDPRFPPK